MVVLGVVLEQVEAVAKPLLVPVLKNTNPRITKTTTRITKTTTRTTESTTRTQVPLAQGRFREPRILFY